MNITRHGILLEPTDHPWENRAVLNPTTFRDADGIHMLYRAVDQNMVSSIGYCRLDDDQNVVERREEPVLAREFEFERKGVEDPRLTRIGDTFYLTYIAWDGVNAQIAFAVSKQLPDFEKRGIIGPSISYQEAEGIFLSAGLKEHYLDFTKKLASWHGEVHLLWDKDAVLFPRQFDGRYAMLHRILPEIQTVFFEDFPKLTDHVFWRSYLAELSDWVTIPNELPFEKEKNGAGVIVEETNEGWLVIYHGVSGTHEQPHYAASAALLSKDDPRKLLAKLPGPFMEPEEEWEMQGDKNTVVFPTGSVTIDDTIHLYYGGGDMKIGRATLSRSELLEALLAAKKS